MHRITEPMFSVGIVFAYVVVVRVIRVLQN
jgi:hypothetical protein